MDSALSLYSSFVWNLPWSTVGSSMRSSTMGVEFAGLATRSYSATVQWNHRMRNRRRVSPCVHRIMLVSVSNRPASMSRTMWSSKMVMRSKTSAPDSPFGNR